MEEVWNASAVDYELKDHVILITFSSASSLRQPWSLYLSIILIYVRILAHIYRCCVRNRLASQHCHQIMAMNGAQKTQRIVGIQTILTPSINGSYRVFSILKSQFAPPADMCLAIRGRRTRQELVIGF